MPETYEVYLLRYTLSLPDPDLLGPRYHTAIFVETGPPSSSIGTLHQVTGDITSPSGMYYFPQPKSEVDKDQQPHSVEYIGITPKSSYPEQWDKCLRDIPPPGQQKAFNVRTMRTEPFKSKDPGWGDGFLSFVASPADGVNHGKSGTTTVSWLANGRWEDLVDNINETVSDYETIVTMQFGHNDQMSLGLDEYESNLMGIVSDLLDLGATPIIISPLSRRHFDGDTVTEDFVEWRERAITAAEDSDIDYLHLTTASTDYISSIGSRDAATYDLGDGDGTHINEAGGIVFGRMVADLLLEKREDLEEYITPNEGLSERFLMGSMRVAMRDGKNIVGSPIPSQVLSPRYFGQLLLP
ncbi:SGNH hydrolase-type esterase domain-containing protein [Aspergillus oleicola]